MKKFVAFSGGKDSTALALLMEDAQLIFTDTKWEYPEVYQHLDKFEQITGREVLRLTHPDYPGGLTEIYSLACDILEMENATAKELLPTAQKLANMVIENKATEATLNIAESLLNWIKSPKRRGRAWNIKSASRQLAESVIERPELDEPINKDDIPF